MGVIASICLASLLVISIVVVGKQTGKDPKPAYQAKTQTTPSDVQAAPQAANANDQVLTASNVETYRSVPADPNVMYAIPKSKNTKQKDVFDAVSSNANTKPMRSANSLPTGTQIISSENDTGRGEPEAINGTNYDACVIVVDASTHERVRYVYIEANDSLTLRRLNPGEYEVVFTTGIDWDNVAERFNRDAFYFDFDKELAFDESRRGNYLEYDHHSITLNPVVNGNVSARSISESESHRMSGKE
jgi:hypothetical protein